MSRAGDRTGWGLIVAAFAAIGLSPSAPASDVFVAHGWLERAQESDYVMRGGPGEGVRLEIDDPLGQIVGNVPDYHRLTVQCNVLQATGIGIPKVRVVNVHPPSTMAPGGLPCGVDPGRFASCVGTASSSGLDSDGDGVPDIDDDFPFDPNEDTDTDGDGIGNNADNDDDGDLIPDAYEDANGLDRLVDDASGDLDGDGQTNLAEAVAGTSANNGSSYFRIERWRRLDPGTLQIRWEALPGRVYAIYYAPDLQTLPTPIATGITVGSPGLNTESLPSPSERGFYFVEAQADNP